MIVGILSRKGGVGKTTLAVHLAALFARSGKTLLVDEDETRNATTWARGGGMPYKTVNMQAMAREARVHEHIVVDSRGGMDAQSMRDLYDGTDRIIVPAAPEYMTMDTLLQTVEILKAEDPALARLRIVMTMTRPGRKLDDARLALTDLGLAPIEASIRFSEAFRDATEQAVLVRDVKGNKLAKTCWADCEAVFREVTA